MEKKITAQVARDEGGHLYFYSEMPRKNEEFGYWNGKILVLPQVNWEDKEPTEVELTIKICE